VFRKPRFLQIYEASALGLQIWTIVLEYLLMVLSLSVNLFIVLTWPLETPTTGRRFGSSVCSSAGQYDLVLHASFSELLVRYYHLCKDLLEGKFCSGLGGDESGACF
jgi:hypothetical protein